MIRPILSCLLLVCGLAHAETRAPSVQEAAAFHAYFQQHFPNEAGASPTFSVTRADRKAPWRIEAVVEMAPRRGLRTLCRTRRVQFRHERAWSTAEAPRQYVWLDRAGCRAGANSVELRQRMPDIDVLALLEREAQLLQRARLIMAGNSSCAALRSSPFALKSIDVGPSGSGNEEMAQLVYRSDKEAILNVWVRRGGSGLDGWNVGCIAAPP